jgi:hypothetical protein
MEVLNTIVYPIAYHPGFSILGTAFLFLFSLCVVALIQEAEVGFGDINLAAAITTLGLIFGILAGAFFCTRYNVYENRYQVILDGTMTAEEFNEKYEVITQEGKIYTVRDKTEETWVE